MNSERLPRLFPALVRAGIDLLALMPGSNLRYLTGLVFHPSKRLTLALFPASPTSPTLTASPASDAGAAGGACLTLPELEAPGIRPAVEGELDLFPWSDEEGPARALKEALAQAAGREPRSLRVGVEFSTMRVMELRALEQAGRELGLTLETMDATPVLSAMRMVKDTEEIVCMAEAARIVETALHEVIGQIRPGVTERQLSRICSNAILAAGGEGESFDNLVASGPNSANPHHGGSDRAFQPGDLIILDCGAIYRGYASDITRTVCLGHPVAEVREIYEVVKAANEAGRKAARAGVTGEQIDTAARGVIEKAGYGPLFFHRTGHGLGLEVHPCHEPPDLVAGSTLPLAAGTTVTIEPGIYLEGVGGVRIEDDVVLEADGCRSLTSFSRDLTVLPL